MLNIVKNLLNLYEMKLIHDYTFLKEKYVTVMKLKFKGPKKSK